MVKKVLSSVFSLISPIIRLKMDRGNQQMRKMVTMLINNQQVLHEVEYPICIMNSKSMQTFSF